MNVPTEHVSRRTVLQTLAATAAGGGAYLAFGATNVSAKVSGELSVPDDSYAATGGTIHSPRIAVDMGWSFSGASAASTVMLAVLFDGGLATSTTESVTGPEDSGRTELVANVVESRQWESADWQAPDGGEVSNDVTAEVRLEVRDSGGETLTSAAASDTATITVSDAGDAMSVDVSGSGDVTFVPSEDATPTG